MILEKKNIQLTFTIYNTQSHRVAASSSSSSAAAAAAAALNH